MTCQEAFTIMLSAIDSDLVIIIGMLLPFICIAATAGYYRLRYGHSIRAWNRLNKGLFE